MGRVCLGVLGGRHPCSMHRVMLRALENLSLRGEDVEGGPCPDDVPRNWNLSESSVLGWSRKRPQWKAHSHLWYTTTPQKASFSTSYFRRASDVRALGGQGFMELGGGLHGQSDHHYVLFPCSTWPQLVSLAEFSSTPLLPNVIISLECFSLWSEKGYLHLRGGSVGKIASPSFLLGAVPCFLSWCVPGGSPRPTRSSLLAATALHRPPVLKKFS